MIIKRIREFYEWFYKDLSIFGKSTIFPLAIFIFPIIVFIVACVKEDD